MTEQILERAFAEVYRREFSGFDDPPEHRFSLRHRLKMKRIISLSDKNLRTAAVPKCKLSRRTMIAIAAIILAALIAGCSAGIISHFAFEHHNDNSIIIHADPDIGKQRITELYYIPELPEGFKLVTEMTLDMCEYKMHTVYYRCTEQGKEGSITFTQSTYDICEVHYSNKYNYIEEVSFGDNTGYCVEYTKGGSKTLLWDNGEYVFELSSGMKKEELIRLAESMKYTDVS